MQKSCRSIKVLLAFFSWRLHCAWMAHATSVDTWSMKYTIGCAVNIMFPTWSYVSAVYILVTEVLMSHAQHQGTKVLPYGNGAGKMISATHLTEAQSSFVYTYTCTCIQTCVYTYIHMYTHCVYCMYRTRDKSCNELAITQ